MSELQNYPFMKKTCNTPGICGGNVQNKVEALKKCASGMTKKEREKQTFLGHLPRC